MERSISERRVDSCYHQPVWGDVSGVGNILSCRTSDAVRVMEDRETLVYLSDSITKIKIYMYIICVSY